MHVGVGGGTDVTHTASAGIGSNGLRGHRGAHGVELVTHLILCHDREAGQEEEEQQCVSLVL